MVNKSSAELNNDNKLIELDDDYLKLAICSDCFEIINEELEYYYKGKEQSLGLFLNSIDSRKLKDKLLQVEINNFFNKTTELPQLIQKIERALLRELNRTDFKEGFSLDSSICLVEYKASVVTSEELRTLELVGLVNKGIDMAWKKAGASFIPKEMKKFAAKVKLGDYVLNMAGLSPQELNGQLKDKVALRVKGQLKQMKLDLQKHLEDHIIDHIFKNAEIKDNIMKRQVVKSA